MAPTVGLNPKQPQKLAGRRLEPRTWVPSPTLMAPTATAAAEPLLEPPGVRAGSHGLRVPRGSVAANSVVTVLPRITAPASRKAATAAASRPEYHPSNNGEPISVAISMVSMMSLTPIGMPSIADKGFLSFQRRLDASAAARAPLMLVWTNAPIFGSQAAPASRQRSRNARGVSSLEANLAVAAKNGRGCGTCAAAGDSMIKPRPASSLRPGVGSQSWRCGAEIGGPAPDRPPFPVVHPDCAAAFPDHAPPVFFCWRLTVPAHIPSPPCG